LPAPTSECLQLKNQTNKQTRSTAPGAAAGGGGGGGGEAAATEKTEGVGACLLACTSLVAKNQNKGIWGFFFGHLFGLLLPLT